MKIPSRRLASLLIISIVLLLFISSCNKRITYLQVPSKEKIDSIYFKSNPGYLLQTGDILFVQIITGNVETDNLFNKYSQSQSSSMAQQENLYIYGYSVNDTGYIDLPVIGFIKIAGTSLADAKQIITNKSKEYLKDAYVVVKLSGFRFSVLGEVKKPGVFMVPSEEINIFEAISYAGDLSYYGRRKSVLVLRQVPNGTITYTVNLTDRNLLKSPAYHIQPNDIIYIEPVNMVGLRTSIQDYLIIISSISSTLTAIALIISLSKK